MSLGALVARLRGGHEHVEVFLDVRRRPDLDSLVLQDLGHLAKLRQRRHEP